MATIRVTTTIDHVLGDAYRLTVKRKPGEDVWQAQARTLGELGYTIIGKDDAEELARLRAERNETLRVLAPDLATAARTLPQVAEAALAVARRGGSL